MADAKDAEIDDGGDRHKRRRRRFKIALWLLAALSVLEGGARLQQRWRVGPFPSHVPRHLVDFYRFYRVNPGYRSDTVRINSQGFRSDEETPRAKPAGVIRIFMTGGSTVWGEDGPGAGDRIDNTDTMAAHLQVILNERAMARGLAVRVQVINAGVVGYLLFQGERYFSSSIADYQPDLVIAMDGHNDLDALQLGVPLYRHRNDPVFDRELNDPLAFDVYRSALRYAEHKSMFVRKVSSWVSGQLNQLALGAMQSRYDSRPDEARIGAWLDAYAATVRRYDAAGRIASTPILFTIQLEVASEFKKPLTAAETEMRDVTYAYTRWLHGEMRDRLVARMADLRREHGIWFEDVSGAFAAEREQAYLDYTHLTGRGAATMAKHLAVIVEPAVFCGPSAPRIRSCGTGDLPR